MAHGVIEEDIHTEKLCTLVFGKVGADKVFDLAELDDPRRVRSEVNSLANRIYDELYDVDRQFTRLMKRLSNSRTSKPRRREVRVDSVRAAIELLVERHRSEFSAAKITASSEAAA